jgi:hypothetical protein
MNFTMLVGAAYPNMTLAIFDPPIIPSSNPGAVTNADEDDGVRGFASMSCEFRVKS